MKAYIRETAALLLMVAFIASWFLLATVIVEAL